MGTLLSTMINQQNNYQTLATIPEKKKVGFIDIALHSKTVDYKFPFRLKSISKKIFDNVLFYPFESDYDALSFMDNDEELYTQRARFTFRSYTQFLEDQDYRNDWAEIIENGSSYLGCRYKTKNASSRIIDNAETVANWSVSGDADSVELDNTLYKEGNGSMKVVVTNNLGTATIENSFTSFLDTLYKRKYQFFWIYLPVIPTSITLRFGNDNSNYLYTVITTQFSGQSFEAGAWNLIAQNLDEATEVGTVDSSVFDYQAIILTGSDSGTYYIDSSYLRQWELLDLWYYSKNMVQLSDGTFQELFINPNTEDYATDSSLIGPTEWSDFINLQAMILGAIDKNDQDLKRDLMVLMSGGILYGKKHIGVEEKLKARYKSNRPFITDNRWRFSIDPMSKYSRYPVNYED